MRAEMVGGVPDAVKWTAVAVLLLSGVAGFHFFAEYTLLGRVVALLLLVAAAGFVSVQTGKGRIAWEFVKESRTEVRKVVWPTRKETLQTTGIVIAMVAVCAVILWMLDSLFGWLVRILLGS